MTKIDAYFIGWYFSVDGHYNGITEQEATRQIAEFAQEIQNEFIRGRVDGLIRKQSQSRIPGFASSDSNTKKLYSA